MGIVVEVLGELENFHMSREELEVEKTFTVILMLSKISLFFSKLDYFLMMHYLRENHSCLGYKTGKAYK